MKKNQTHLLISDNRSFRDNLDRLGPGDRIAGLLNIKPSEEYLFLDLVERGVNLFPSALSQQLSRSKCFQALVLRKWMVPHTYAVRDRHDMINIINVYGREGISSVITKQNRHNCGLGIHLWDSIESVYNQACFGGLEYPFVVQPFVPDVTDVRVIILGDYSEAYWRKNSDTFRNNIFFGGKSGPFELSEEQWELCRQVMKRGKFPYGHLDLMISKDGNTYLAEINLRGGLKGARITTVEYKKRIEEIEKSFLEESQE